MNTVAIIGAGPSGIMAAITAKEINPNLEIVVFEKNEPLQTILYTGGGRCNLAYNEYDFKDLASNFPRGKKFLYSVFSRFGLAETLEFFERIGVHTYSQEDNRIFPVSDDANEVRGALLKRAKELNIKIPYRTEVVEIKKENGQFLVNGKPFDKLVISTGGRYKNQNHTGFYFSEKLGHTIKDLKPALCGLKTSENWLKTLSGVSLKNINAEININQKTFYLCEDVLFTHQGITGPLAYKISSLCAFEDYSSKNPIQISLNISNKDFDSMDKELLAELDSNSMKSIQNIVAFYLPRSAAKILLEESQINPEKKAHEIARPERIKIVEILTALKIFAYAPASDGEIVTAGGVELDEVNSSTMESKLVKNLYFCGEVLNIDGFTGGFNLQNCWSTGHVAGYAVGLSCSQGLS